MHNIVIGPFEVKAILLSVVFIFIYFRKKLKAFMYLSIGCLSYSIISVLFIHNHTTRIFLLITVLVIAFISSYKELAAYEKAGISARQALDFNKYDYAVFVLLLIIWLFVKKYLSY